jgi:hypothetical protein
MKSKSATETLNEMIVIQKMIYDNDLELLKKQFHVAYESVKPINLVKNFFHETIASPEIKNDFLSKIIGFGTGILSKKLLLGSTHNPVTKILGTFLEFAVASKVSKHSEMIKRIGGNLFKRFFNKS